MTSLTFQGVGIYAIAPFEIKYDEIANTLSILKNDVEYLKFSTTGLTIAQPILTGTITCNKVTGLLPPVLGVVAINKTYADTMAIPASRITGYPSPVDLIKV